RPAVRPPEDPALAEGLVALRSAAATARVAAEAGRPDPAAERRVARLEQQVRRRVLATSRPGASGRRQPLDVPTTTAGRGESALVSSSAHNEQLPAVSVVDGRARLPQLGRPARLHAELESLRFALHRQARGTSGATAAAVSAVAAAASSTLDAA